MNPTAIFICVCTALINTEYRGDDSAASDALAFCQEIEPLAINAGLDPYELVTVSWIESRFKVGAIGRGGEQCGFQVNPKFLAANAPGKSYQDALTNPVTCIQTGIVMALAWKKLAGDRWSTCYQNCKNESRKRNIEKWMLWLRKQETKCRAAVGEGE